MQLVEVSPDMAEKWLADYNTHNRPLTQLRVRSYAEAMKKGLWRHPTGEPIIFDSLHRLQDGQHRLAAQVAAQVTINYWVNFDADPQDFVVIDQGKARTASDVLATQGVSSYSNSSTICRTLIMMQTKAHRTWSGTSVTPAEISAFAEKDLARLNMATTLAKSIWSETRIPVAAMGAVIYWADEQLPGSQQLHDFVQQVKAGVGLFEGSPAHTLRKWAVQRPRNRNQQQQTNVVFVTKAWNSFAANRELKKLVWLSSEMPMPLPSAPLY
jgi:hypothetical protein